MITRAIENCLIAAKERGWEKTYWAVDIHGTILKSNFRRDAISTEFYPGAIEVLQFLTSREDIITILYTCSYPHEIEQYIELFDQNGIRFNYINKNPEVPDGGYGYYQDKFYINVLMDDKAGFDGETDWLAIKEIISKHF